MDQIVSWDHQMFHMINAVMTHPWLDSFFPAITDLHKLWLFNLIVYPLFLGLFYWKYQKKGFLIFFGLLLCLGSGDFLGNVLIKKQVQRPRPGDTPGVEAVVRSPYGGGSSFTSNHATNMFALAVYTTRFLPLMAVPTFTVAALVSYSRVYNGVHFPLDVICGALFGSLWSFFFSKLLRKQLEKGKHP